NSTYSVEVRWSNSGVVLSNILADAPLHARDGGVYTGGNNYLSATTAMFVNAAAVDLHLLDTTATRANVIDRAAAVTGLANDFDLQGRPAGAAPDVGADELTVTAPPPRVQSVVVNGGAAQRSMVTSLTVTFSGVVTLGSGAFVLTADAGGAAVGLSPSVSTVNGQTVVTLTFTGV